MRDEPLPHDLLEIAAAGALVCAAPPPSWARTGLARAPFVVVRRARRVGALLPVGVRGAARDERLPARLPPGAALRRIRPEDLAAARGRAARRDLPAFAALDAAAAALDALGVAWGPAGSAGFELATGVATVTPESDLDLVVRAPAPLPRGAAAWLRSRLAALPCRADVQLETPAGALALAEWASGAARVAVRTALGPRLLDDPWAAGAGTEPVA